MHDWSATGRKTLLALFTLMLSGCFFRIDSMHPLIRSDVFETMEEEKAIVAKARLSTTPDGKIKVLFVRGTPYERGYQQGALLREEVTDNLEYIYNAAISKFGSAELFDEAYERMRPFISQEYIDEMHGLAHGARIPLRVVQGFHALPSIAEWGGKKRIKEVAKKMFWGELGTSCSNFSICEGATADNNFYAIRILDWGLHRISKAHEYPLITVTVPETGLASVNIGWAGFLGAVSGMNESGITLGEMGYGNPPGETMRGVPMPFLLRDVMTKAHSLPEVQNIIKSAVGDCAYIYLMTDGKTRESELYIRDRERFVVFKPEENLVDRDNNLAAIEDTLYGGHYADVMTAELKKWHGSITPEVLMKELIPKFAMPSNFQNVIYDPVSLKFWVSNARSSKDRAAEQPYTQFNFGEELQRFRSGN